jgi:hypothetical protein
MINNMSNPKLIKNGGKGTFFGNLLRGIAETGKTVGVPILDAISGGKVSDILKAITSATELTETEKEILIKELEQDVIEMQEISKRWNSDMVSDSWLSKNVRPLALIFLTITMAIYITIDSSVDGFEVKEDWISLLSSLLLLVYGAYFGGRSLEKIQKMRKSK